MPLLAEAVGRDQAGRHRADVVRGDRFGRGRWIGVNPCAMTEDAERNEHEIDVGVVGEALLDRRLMAVRVRCIERDRAHGARAGVRELVHLFSRGGIANREEHRAAPVGASLRIVACPISEPPPSTSAACTAPRAFLIRTAAHFRSEHLRAVNATRMANPHKRAAMIKRRVLTAIVGHVTLGPVGTAGRIPWPKRLYSLLGPYRYAANVLVDLTIWSSAMVVATFLRYEFNFRPVHWQDLGKILPIIAVVHLVLGTYEGLYVGRWSFGSFEEVAALARFVIVTGRSSP